MQIDIVHLKTQVADLADFNERESKAQWQVIQFQGQRLLKAEAQGMAHELLFNRDLQTVMRNRAKMKFSPPRVPVKAPPELGGAEDFKDLPVQTYRQSLPRSLKGK